MSVTTKRPRIESSAVGGKVVRAVFLLSVVLRTLELFHETQWVHVIIDRIQRNNETTNQLDNSQNHYRYHYQHQQQWLDQQQSRQQSVLPTRETNDTIDEYRQTIYEGLEGSDPYSNGNKCEMQYSSNQVEADVVKMQQDATVKLLYNDVKEQQYWLNQPPLSIYIYDNMPEDYSDYGKVSECINSRFGLREPCRQLPGDGSVQKRFFDVIMNGCIPVVPEFPSTEDGLASFHRFYGASTRVTYPFSIGNYIHDPTAGMDMRDMVVTFNGTCGIRCMMEPLEQLLADHDKLKKKRLNLKAYAQISTFGLSKETTMSYPDAFSATMVTIRHKVWALMGRTSTRHMTR